MHLAFFVYDLTRFVERFSQQIDGRSNATNSQIHVSDSERMNLVNETAKNLTKFVERFSQQISGRPFATNTKFM